MERNIMAGIIIPEMPKMIPNEQYLLYGPVASSEAYGSVKLGDSKDEMYYFVTKDGVINLDIDKVKNYLGKEILDKAEDAMSDAQGYSSDAKTSSDEAKESATKAGSYYNSTKALSDAFNRKYQSIASDINSLKQNKLDVIRRDGSFVYAQRSGTYSYLPYTTHATDSSIPYRKWPHQTFEVGDPVEDGHPVTLRLLKNELRSYLPLATDKLNGVITGHQYKVIEAMDALLDQEGGKNEFVDTVTELLEVFKNYNSETNIVELLNSKVSCMSGASKVYAINAQGRDTGISFDFTPLANGIPRWTSNKELRGNTTGTANDGLVNLAYFNENVLKLVPIADDKKNGLITPAQYKLLTNLAELLTESEGGESTVDTLAELIKVFEGMGEDAVIADILSKLRTDVDAKVQFKPNSKNAVYANSSGIGSDVHLTMIRYTQSPEANTMVARDTRGTFRIAHPQDDPAENYTASIDHEPVTVGYFKKNMSNSNYLATDKKNGLISPTQYNLLTQLGDLMEDGDTSIVDSLTDILNLFKNFDSEADLADTLATLSDAVDERVVKSDRENIVYGRDSAGNEVAILHSIYAYEGSIAERTAQGTLRTKSPTHDDDAVNLSYFNEKVGNKLENWGELDSLLELVTGNKGDGQLNRLDEFKTFISGFKEGDVLKKIIDGKAPKLSGTQVVYTLNSAGNLNARKYTAANENGSIPYRSTGNTFKIGDPSHAQHPVTKQYLENSIAGLLPLASSSKNGMITSSDYNKLNTIYTAISGNDAAMLGRIAELVRLLNEEVEFEGSYVSTRLSDKVECVRDKVGVYGTLRYGSTGLVEYFYSLGQTTFEANSIVQRDANGRMRTATTNDDLDGNVVASVSHVKQNTSKAHLEDVIGFASTSSGGLMSSAMVDLISSLVTRVNALEKANSK